MQYYAYCLRANEHLRITSWRAIRDLLAIIEWHPSGSFPPKIRAATQTPDGDHVDALPISVSDEEARDFGEALRTAIRVLDRSRANLPIKALPAPAIDIDEADLIRARLLADFALKGEFVFQVRVHSESNVASKQASRPVQTGVAPWKRAVPGLVASPVDFAALPANDANSGSEASPLSHADGTAPWKRTLIAASEPLRSAEGNAAVDGRRSGRRSKKRRAGGR